MTDVAEVPCPEFVTTWVRSGQWLSLGDPVPDSVLAAARLPGFHQVHVDPAAFGTGLVADALRSQPKTVVDRMVYVPQALSPGPEAAVGHADQLGLPVLVWAPDSLALSGPRVVPFETFGGTGAVLVHPAERLTRAAFTPDGRALTLARLSSIADGVVESVGANQDELALLGALAGALYPAGVRRLPGPAHTVTGTSPTEDDFRTVEHWGRTPSWEAVDGALQRSGPGSTALVLALGTDGRLRSVVVYRSSDERSVWLDLRAGGEARLVPDEGRSRVIAALGDPAESRILLIDPGGGTIENRQLILPPATISTSASTGRAPVVAGHAGGDQGATAQSVPGVRQTEEPVLWDEAVEKQGDGLVDVIPGLDHRPVFSGSGLAAYLRGLRDTSTENDVPADLGAGAARRTIRWIRDTVNAATTDSALATLLGDRPGTGPQGLTVEVEIGLLPASADETAQEGEVRAAREADFGDWLTAQVYRHLNVGLTRWAQREGNGRVLPQVRVRHSVVRGAATEFVRLRGRTHDPVPDQPHQLTGQFAHILRGRAIDVALDPSSGQPTEQATVAIDLLAQEVADQAVLRHLIVDEFWGQQIVKLAPKETSGPYVELAATYDGVDGSPDDAEEAIVYVADPFERSLRTAISDRIAALTGVRADPAHVLELFSRVRIGVEPQPVSDGSAPTAQLGYVIPSSATRVDDLVAPRLEYLSRWRLSPLSSGQDGWWRAHDPVPDVDDVVAALPTSAFHTVEAEMVDISERSGRPELFRKSHLNVRYDVARVEIQDDRRSRQASSPRHLRAFRLRLHLAAEENVTAADIEAYQAHAQAAIRQEINGRFRLPGGDQFHLDVRFTDDAKSAHHVIRVPVSGSMDHATWPQGVLGEPLQQVRDSVLHEMLHLLGLPDEYVQSGGPSSSASILRRTRRAADDLRGPRRPDLPPALMQDITRVGGDHIIAPRYLWEIAFIQESHLAAPLTTVRRGGAIIEVTPPVTDGPAAVLEHMFAEHPATSTMRLADNLRYEHDVTAALLAANPDRVEGYTYVMLPTTVAERLVAGERFPLRGQSDDFEFEDVPDGYTVVVVHSTSLLLDSSEGELRFVLPSPDAPIVLRQSWPNGGGYFEQVQPSGPEADQVAEPGVMVDLSDPVEPATFARPTLGRPPTQHRVLRKPEPTVARPRGGVARHVPDRRMDQPTLTTLTPTRRRRPAPEQVTPSSELSEDPQAVFRRVATMSRSVRNEYRRWADEVIEGRQSAGGVAGLTPVRRAELGDRVLDLLRNNDHRQQYEAERLAGDFVDGFLRDGPPPLPTPLFGRDLEAEFTFAPGATDLSWPDHAELDAFVRSIVAETSRRVEDGLAPLRLRAAVGPGRVPGLIDRLMERVPGLARGLGGRAAEARSHRLTETLMELLKAHDRADNGVVLTQDAVQVVTTPREQGPSHDWVRIWVGAPASQQGPAVDAVPPEQVPTAGPSRLEPSTTPDEKAATPDEDATTPETGHSPNLEAYRQFREYGLPHLSVEGDAASVADELAWAFAPGALSTAAADVLERAGLRALAPANDGYLAAAIATLTHRRLPGGDELAEQPPEMFHVAIAGMLEAELSSAGTDGPRLGLDTADDTARQQVVGWIAEGLPPSRVPEAIRTALRLEDSTSGRVRAVVTLMANLIERPIDVLFPDGVVHRTGDQEPARDALLLVATDDGQLLATVPRDVVPALLPARGDRILVATELGAEASMPSDVATFDTLQMFLEHLAGAEDLPLLPSEQLAASLRGAAAPAGNGLAEVLRQVRAASTERATGTPADPAELTVLPLGSTSVNRLTEFQVGQLEAARLGAVWTAPGTDSLFEALRLSARHGAQRISDLATVPAPALRHNIAALLLADLAASGGVAAPLLGLASQIPDANRESVLRWISRLATPGASLPRQTPRRIAQVLTQVFATRVELIHPTHVETVPATGSTEDADAPPLRLLVTAGGHVMPAVPVSDRYDALRRPADAPDVLDDATDGSQTTDGAARPVQAPEAGSIAHTIGIPHQTLPHLDEAVANIIAAAHVRGVTMSPDEQAMLPSRLLSNYRELVAGGHLVQVGGVEMLVRLDPTEAALAPNPADRRYVADEADDWDAEDAGAHPTDPETRKKLFHATQATSSGFNTGGGSLSNSGQAGALRGAVGLGLGLGLGPGVLEVARAGVTISGTVNRVDRTTFGVQDAESGRVQDDRIDSTLVSYTPNWSVRVRSDDSTGWADLPTTWSSAQDHPDGQERLEVWIPDHYLQEGEAQVQAVRPTGDEALAAEFDRLSKQLPDGYFATGLTGLPELYDRIIAELRANGLSLDPAGPERRELRQALWKLSFNLDTAINNRVPPPVAGDLEWRRRRVQANAGGYPITLHDRGGHAVAVVIVQTERDARTAITRVGATSDKSHTERASTAIGAQGGSFGLTNESDIRLSGELNFMPVPGLVLGPSLGVGWTWTSKDSVSGGHTGIWVHVSRYAGRTAGYKLGLRHKAIVHVANKPRSKPTTTAAVSGEALLRLPEPAAFAHGFPVDASGLRQPPDPEVSTVEYAPGLVNDGSTPASELENVVLPQHVAKGRGIGMGVATVDDRVAEELRGQVLSELSRTGYVPPRRFPFTTQPTLGANAHIGSDSRLANLSLLDKFISTNAFSAFYDQLHQDGLSFTLRGDPSGQRTRRARVTIKAVQDPQKLSETNDRGNSTLLQRRTDEYNLVNLAIGSSSGAYNAGRRRAVALSARFAAGVKLMQTWGVAAEYGYGKGVSQTAGQTLSEPQLLEYPGEVDEFRLPSSFQVTVDYEYKPRRQSSTWQGEPVDGEATVLLVPSINTETVEDQAPMDHATDVSVLDQAVIYYADTTGLVDAARRLQPILTGPGKPSDEEVSIFAGTTAVRSYFKEILHDEYLTENFFRAGFLRHKQGGLGVHGTVGPSRFVGATSDQFTSGLIKLYLAQASHGHSSGHGIKFLLDQKVKAVTSADNLSAVQSQPSAWVRYGVNKSKSSSRTGGVEILDLDFHNVYAFLAPVDFTLTGTYEAHTKLLPTSVSRPPSESVDGRQMIYLLPEHEALKRYGEGAVPIGHTQLMNALRRWKDGGGDAKEKLELSRQDVRAVIERMDHESQMMPDYPHHQELRNLRAYLTELSHDALSSRLATLGFDSVAELTIPDHLLPNGPTSLGHSGVHTLSFRDPANKAVRPLDIVHEAIEAAVPGLLGARRSQWTPDKADRGPVEVFWRRVVGEKPVMGRLTGGLDYLETMFTGTRLKAMSDDLMQGVQFYLVNKVAVALTEVVEVKLRLTLGTAPQIFDFVPKTGIERYGHAYSAQSLGTSKGFSGGVSPVPPAFAGADNTANTSGALGLSFAGGRQTGVVQSHQSTEEQTVYDWVAHYLARSDVSLSVEVNRLDMPNRGFFNLLMHGVRPLTGQSTPVRREREGELVLKMPHSVAEARRLSRRFDKSDLRALPKLPPGAYVHTVFLEDALAAGWGLLGRMFGPEANDSTFRSSVTLPTLLSPGHLSNFLHRAVAGRRLTIADDIFLPDRSRTRASLHLVGDFHHLEVLLQLDGSGTGRYAKDQAGTSVTASRDEMRPELSASVNQDQALGVNDPAHPTAPWGTHTGAANPKFNRVAPRGDGSGQTVNYRTEQHVKQQGRLYLVRMRFKGRLEADRFEMDPSQPTGSFVSDRFTGPVYAELFEHEIADLQARLSQVPAPEPTTDPGRWPRPDDHTPRHDLDQLASVPARAGHDQLTVAELVSGHIRDYARTNQVVLFSSAARRAYHRYLLVEEWAIKQLGEGDPDADRLRRDVAGRYDLMWKINESTPTPAFVDELTTRTARLIELVRERKSALIPPVGFTSDTYDPLLTARLVAHNLRRYVQFDLTEADGTVTSHRIDPGGHLAPDTEHPPPDAVGSSAADTTVAPQASVLSPVIDTGPTPDAPLTDPVVLPPGSRAELDAGQLYWVGPQPKAIRGDRIRSAAAAVDGPVVYLGSARPGLKPLDADVRDVRRLVQQLALKKQQPVVVTTAQLTPALKTMSQTYGFSIVHLVPRAGAIAGGLASLPSAVARQPALAPAWQVVGGNGAVEDLGESLGAPVLLRARELARPNADSTSWAVAKLLLAPTRDAKLDVFTAFRTELTGRRARDELRKIVEQMDDDDPWFRMFTPLLGELGESGRAEFVLDFQALESPVERNSLLIGDVGRGIDRGLRVGLIQDSGYQVAGAATALHAVDLMFTDGLQAAVTWVRDHSADLRNDEKQNWVDAIREIAGRQKNRAADFLRLAQEVFNC
ncbi:hypothetical protein [Micromonospora sp. B9E7]|uniref:hypothetical protein n=1 Tax=Micromonospora sp. B9E7 TaxID=3153574 RepID=UPI00325D2CEA